MSGYASSHGSPEKSARKSSAGRVGWIILAAVLCGAGLFLLAGFLVFFEWWLFLGVLLVIGGALIFFKTWTGPESA